MRPMSVVIGVAVSVVAHALVFAPAVIRSEAPDVEPDARLPPPAVVVVATVPTESDVASPPDESAEAPWPPPVEPQPAPEAAPEPRPEVRIEEATEPVVAAEEAPVPEPPPEPAAPELPAPEASANEPEQQPETVTPALDLVQEHEGGAADVPALPGAAGGEVSDDVPRPELVLRWDGPEHLLAVARDQALRVVAIDERGDVIGEVSRRAGPLRFFDSRVTEFSNRVRSLPRSFFPDVDAGRRVVREYWVLVPVVVDRRFSAMTAAAARGAGLSMERVRAVHAEFTRASGGSFALRVHSVEAR